LHKTPPGNTKGVERPGYLAFLTVSSKRCCFVRLLTLYPLRRQIAPSRKFVQIYHSFFGVGFGIAWLDLHLWPLTWHTYEACGSLGGKDCRTPEYWVYQGKSLGEVGKSQTGAPIQKFCRSFGPNVWTRQDLLTVGRDQYLFGDDKHWHHRAMHHTTRNKQNID